METLTITVTLRVTLPAKLRKACLATWHEEREGTPPADLTSLVEAAFEWRVISGQRSSAEIGTEQVEVLAEFNP